MLSFGVDRLADTLVGPDLHIQRLKPYRNESHQTHTCIASLSMREKQRYKITITNVINYEWNCYDLDVIITRDAVKSTGTQRLNPINYSDSAIEIDLSNDIRQMRLNWTEKVGTKQILETLKDRKAGQKRNGLSNGRYYLDQDSRKKQKHNVTESGRKWPARDVGWNLKTAERWFLCLKAYR